MQSEEAKVLAVTMESANKIKSLSVFEEHLGNLAPNSFSVICCFKHEGYHILKREERENHSASN